MFDLTSYIPPEFSQYAEDILRKNAAKIGTSVWDSVKKQWNTQDVFGAAKENYIRYIREDIGLIQILGMREGINLEEIYIETRIYANEEPFVSDGELRESDNLRRGRRTQLRFQEDTVNLSDLISSGAKLRLMLLGDPGAGKSTSLRSMALACISNHERIKAVKSNKFPVYLELRKYAAYIAENRTTIDEYFFQSYSNLNFKAVMQTSMKSGDVIFLLDALDEVPEEQVILVTEMIKALTNVYNKCDFIVSSRIGSYRPVKGLSVFEIVDFNDEERNQYIKLWFSQSSGTDKSQDLSKIISEQHGVEEITTNPLLLSLVCLLYSKDIEIPSHKSYLYDRCIQILIKEWDTDRDFRRISALYGLTDDRKILILSELAYYFMINHQRYFRINDIIGIMENILDKYEFEKENAKSFLEEIVSHHGLIVKVGHEMYGFSHLTFQEYLTAKYYVKNNMMRELAMRYEEDNTWKEIVVLASGETNDIKTLINYISISKEINSFDKIDIVSSAINNRAVVEVKDRPRITQKVIDIARQVIFDSQLTEASQDIKNSIIKAAKLRHIQEILEHLPPDDIKVYRIAKGGGTQFIKIFVTRYRPWMRYNEFQGSTDTDEFLKILFSHSSLHVINAYTIDIDEECVIMYNSSHESDSLDFVYFEL